jgi:trimethylguanosine synthase
MGRSSKQNKKRQQIASSIENKNDPKQKQKQRRPNKRQKRERFWIEDCKDSSLPESSSLSNDDIKQITLEVLITQTQLVDDYRQVPQSSKSDSATVAVAVAVAVGGKFQIEFNKKEEDLKTTGSSSTSNLEIKKDNDIDNVQEKQPKELKNIDTTTKLQEGENNNSNNNNNTISKDTENNESTDIKSKDIIIKDDISNAFISIKRAKSAMKHMEVTGNSVENFRPLPNGDCGDGICNPYDNNEVPDKFWSQRRRLFKLFDEGIQLDKESWYSVTPEVIANHISSHLVNKCEDTIVLDPFVGCGGNAIAFARLDEVKLVVCVDKDRSKLLKAAHNAAIYGIPPEKIVFLHDNACNILSYYKDKKLIKSLIEGNDSQISKNKSTNSKEFKIGGVELLPNCIDVIFLSPPWGGMDYAKVGKRNYTLRCIKIDGIEDNTTLDGDDILNKAADALGKGGPIGLFLPKNINGISLGRSVLRAGYDCPVVMEKNILNGKLKTVTAYIGL